MDGDFWFGKKLMQNIQAFWGYQVHIWSFLVDINLFLTKKVPIFYLSVR